MSNITFTFNTGIHKKDLDRRLIIKDNSAVKSFPTINGNYHVYRKLFPAKQHFFKWIPAPENCKNQETTRNQRKLTEL